MGLQIAGGLVVTPGGVVGQDVIVEGERIRELVEPGTVTNLRVLDATGCYVLPGGVDPHTHLMTDVEPAAHSAAVGGTTTAISFTLPEKGEAPADALARTRDELVPKAVIDVALHAYVSAPDRLTAADVAEVAELGATGIKLFTAYPELGLMASDRTVYETLRAGGRLGLPVLVHCENGAVIEALVEELLAAGNREPRFFAASRPPAVEIEAIARVVALARLADVPVYVVHVSTAGGLRHVEEARADGLPVAAEACTHHLALDGSLYERADAERFLTVPPLRPRSDVEALWRAVRDGTLDTVGSDHSQVRYRPPPAEGFTGLPYGLGGIEARLPLVLSLGRARGVSYERLCDLLATAPARIFGLYPRKGAILPGSDADLVVWDPEAVHWIEGEGPYAGIRVEGSIRAVLLRGAPLVDEGKWVGGKPGGRYVAVSRPGTKAPVPLSGPT